MSLAKARDLMRLAEMAAARHQGVSLSEIAEEFGADHRTAQRMARARGHLPRHRDPHRRGPPPALEAARPGPRPLPGHPRRRARGARDVDPPGRARGARRATSPPSRRCATGCSPACPARTPAAPKADADALLEAQAFAARPGPVARAEPGVLETIAEALKGPFLLAIT
jgi:hypothetical protein